LICGTILTKYSYKNNDVIQYPIESDIPPFGVDKGKAGQLVIVLTLVLQKIHF
jgi:hypothetical protein